MPCPDLQPSNLFDPVELIRMRAICERGQARVNAWVRRTKVNARILRVETQGFACWTICII
jgi:hypothetical protein